MSRTLKKTFSPPYRCIACMWQAGMPQWDIDWRMGMKSAHLTARIKLGTELIPKRKLGGFHGGNVNPPSRRVANERRHLKALAAQFAPDAPKLTIPAIPKHF